MAEENLWLTPDTSKEEEQQEINRKKKEEEDKNAKIIEDAIAEQKRIHDELLQKQVAQLAEERQSKIDQDIQNKEKIEKENDTITALQKEAQIQDKIKIQNLQQELKKKIDDQKQTQTDLLASKIDQIEKDRQSKIDEDIQKKDKLQRQNYEITGMQKEAQTQDKENKDKLQQQYPTIIENNRQKQMDLLAPLQAAHKQKLEQQQKEEAARKIASDQQQKEDDERKKKGLSQLESESNANNKNTATTEPKIEDIHKKYTLTIRLNTRMPNIQHIVYNPSMTLPNTRDKNVLFTPVIELHKNVILNTPSSPYQDKDYVYSQLFNDKSFETLINRTLNSYDQPPLSILQAKEKGITTKNIHVILSTLFKTNNIIYINKNPYTIFGYEWNNDWNVDKDIQTRLKTTKDEVTKEADTELTNFPVDAIKSSISAKANEIPNLQGPQTQVQTQTSSTLLPSEITTNTINPPPPPPNNQPAPPPKIKDLDLSFDSTFTKKHASIASKFIGIKTSNTLNDCFQDIQNRINSCKTIIDENEIMIIQNIFDNIKTYFNIDYDTLSSANKELFCKYLTNLIFHLYEFTTIHGILTEKWDKLYRIRNEINRILLGTDVDVFDFYDLLNLYVTILYEVKNVHYLNFLKSQYNYIYFFNELSKIANTFENIFIQRLIESIIQKQITENNAFVKPSNVEDKYNLLLQNNLYIVTNLHKIITINNFINKSKLKILDNTNRNVSLFVDLNPNIKQKMQTFLFLSPISMDKLYETINVFKKDDVVEVLTQDNTDVFVYIIQKKVWGNINSTQQSKKYKMYIGFMVSENDSEFYIMYDPEFIFGYDPMKEPIAITQKEEDEIMNPMHVQKGGQKGGINKYYQQQQYYDPYYQQPYYNQPSTYNNTQYAYNPYYNQQSYNQQQSYYNPLQTYNPYYNQYYQQQNPILVVREKKTKNESFLTYYVEVDLTLYPGKTIPLEDYSSLICQFKYEKIKESWAELFGYQYAPGIFTKPSDYGLKNKTITATKSNNSQNTIKKNKNAKYNYNTTRNNRNDNNMYRNY